MAPDHLPPLMKTDLAVLSEQVVPLLSNLWVPLLTSVEFIDHLLKFFSCDVAVVIVNIEDLERGPECMVLLCDEIPNARRTELCVVYAAVAIEVQQSKSLFEFSKVCDLSESLKTPFDLVYRENAVLVLVQPNENLVDVLQTTMVEMARDSGSTNGVQCRSLPKMLQVCEHLAPDLWWRCLHEARRRQPIMLENPVNGHSLPGSAFQQAFDEVFRIRRNLRPRPSFQIIPFPFHFSHLAVVSSREWRHSREHDVGHNAETPQIAFFFVHRLFISV
mmetsp:Transcript_7700/g.21002  ORF Transcript_7700/g.21002 Transcript_7700/m.21002 type:complete len:275 (-) Transcript_7700:763-1587(-)